MEGKSRILVFLFIVLAIIGISFNIFFKSPSSKTSQTVFLENLMIREWGFYTLLGSKPVTIFDIASVTDKTEEDFKKSYEGLKTSLLQAKEQENLPYKDRTATNPYKITLPSYREFKKGRKSSLLKFRDTKELWEEWNRNPLSLNPKFLIFSLPSPYGESQSGLFVNIPSLIYILYHYREEFVKRTQLDFTPHEIVYEIQNPNSLFWNKVFHDHFLTGLICGYGAKNAYLFEWGSKHLHSIIQGTNPFFANDIQALSVRGKKDVSPRNLPIPTFFHFGLTDQTKGCYELEREKILEYYSGKNFTKTTLDILKVSEF